MFDLNHDLDKSLPNNFCSNYNYDILKTKLNRVKF